MSDYVITCCSTADMSSSFMAEHEIPFVMFHYRMDGKEYSDDLYASVTPEEFYGKIAAGAQPVTSQVNAEEYIRFFERFLKDGKNIIHLTLSSGISGTINSANVAKMQMEEAYPDRKIIVIDTLGASSGYGLLVTKALENRNAGMDFAQNAAWIEENKLRLHHWFFSTDLSCYVRGGRISKVSGFVGQALNICPLLNMDSMGRLIPRTKCRGKKQVIREIVKRMEEHAQDGLSYSGKCYISQSACREDAEAVARLVEERFPKLDGKVLINDIGTVIGAHTGPGTVALFFWGDERTL